MSHLSNMTPTRARKIGVPGWPKESAFVRNNDYKFRNASLLDIPFIFDLIQDGSQIGSFTEKYMDSKGWVLSLRMLILDVLAPHRNIEHGGYDIKLLIFTLSNEEVGFMKIIQFNDQRIYKIDLCAIAQEYRNQKIGSQMIRMFIEDLPSGAEVFAFCTKYSRAMQHIFKMLEFQRDKKTSILHAELFHFTKFSNLT